MRIQYSSITFVLILLTSVAVSAQSSIYFFYDPSCVEKFDYERVNVFHDIAYTDYYMQVAPDKKAIFRVQKNKLHRTLVSEIPQMPYMCGDRTKVTDKLINQINQHRKVAYMVVEEGKDYSLHEVSSVSILTENQERISYEDAKYGLEYGYDSKAGDVLNAKNNSNKEKSIYFDAVAKNNCLTDYTFKVVSRHPEDPIMKLNIIAGLGVYRFSTDKGEMLLKSINDIPVNTHIATKCNRVVAVETPIDRVFDPNTNPTPVKPKIITDTIGMTALEKKLWKSKGAVNGGTPIAQTGTIKDPAKLPTIVNENPNPNPNIEPSQKQTIAAGDTLPGGFYLVKSKESLYSISSKFGLSIHRLMELNNLKSYALDFNQRLKVYDDGSVPKKNLNPLMKTKGKTQTTIHVVQQGQTLYGISQIYGITLTKLYNLNKQLQNENIDINQQLVVAVQKI